MKLLYVDFKFEILSWGIMLSIFSCFMIIMWFMFKKNKDNDWDE